MRSSGGRDDSSQVPGFAVVSFVSAFASFPFEAPFACFDRVFFSVMRSPEAKNAHPPTFLGRVDVFVIPDGVVKNSKGLQRKLPTEDLIVRTNTIVSCSVLIIRMLRA